MPVTLEENNMATRKKNVVQESGSVIAEHSGYKVGDLVYCQVRGKIHRGTINLIHLDEGSEPHFSFLDDACMNHRVARFSDIIQSPTSQHARQVEREIRKQQSQEK